MFNDRWVKQFEHLFLDDVHSVCAANVVEDWERQRAEKEVDVLGFKKVSDGVGVLFVTGKAEYIEALARWILVFLQPGKVSVYSSDGKD